MKAANVISIFGFAALLLVAIAATHDEQGTTVRYRLGAALSFDPNVTFKDEDNAWNFASPKLANLANLNLVGTTNQLVFGGTNTAPASTNLVLWISVQVPGDTNAYRIGLAK